MKDRAEPALKQWQSECPNQNSEPMVVFGRLAELSQLVSQSVLNPTFAQFDLQPGEFDVLATLRRSGSSYTLAPTQLYQALMISSGSMTNRIDRLVTAGLVERLPNPSDKRGTLVRLTPEGKQRIEKAMTPHLENLTQLLQPLSKKEQKQLSGTLLKLIQSVKQI